MYCILYEIILFYYRSQYTTINKKDERVHRKREREAEAAANIDEKIKQELLSRLHKGTYEGTIKTNKEKQN